jgi:hypothetical protein
MAKLDRASAHGAVHLVGARLAGALAGVLAGALVLGASACTVLFNPDNLDRDGGVPPGVPDAPPGTVDAPPGTPDATPIPRPDAAPGDLEIYKLSPNTVEEGMGVTRRVPVVIEGVNMTDGAMVEVTGPGQDGAAQPLVVSQDGTLAAFEVEVPVDTTRNDSDTDTLTVTVLQGDQTDTLTLNVDWLDELVVMTAGTLDTGTLAAKYSKIEIRADVQATGTAALRLVATEDVVLAASLTADGLNASGQTGGAARAGGCKGGNMAQTGDCTPGGGQGSSITTNAGGGGGGHAVAGDPGQGTGAGVGGGATGEAEMTELAKDHGNGGGGGGDAGSGQGGGGGAGGGVIELTSFGTLRIEASGRLSVRGGNGGSCGGSDDNGGGGGGSGGAVLLRSAQPISGGTSGSILTLDGGQGGSNSCNGEGGDGAPGRARVDATALPNAVMSAAPFHGAVLDPSTPTIHDAAVLAVTVRGGAGKTYALVTQDTDPVSVQLDGLGRGTKDVTLTPGLNRVCVLMKTTDVPGGDDENCLDVAYVP